MESTEFRTIDDRKASPKIPECVNNLCVQRRRFKHRNSVTAPAILSGSSSLRESCFLEVEGKGIVGPREARRNDLGYLSERGSEQGHNFSNGFRNRRLNRRHSLQEFKIRDQKVSKPEIADDISECLSISRLPSIDSDAQDVSHVSSICGSFKSINSEILHGKDLGRTAQKYLRKSIRLRSNDCNRSVAEQSKDGFLPKGTRNGSRDNVDANGSIIENESEEEPRELRNGTVSQSSKQSFHQDAKLIKANQILVKGKKMTQSGQKLQSGFASLVFYDNLLNSKACDRCLQHHAVGQNLKFTVSKKLR